MLRREALEAGLSTENWKRLRDKPQAALIALAAAAALWSLGGLLIKLVQLPSLSVAGYRSLISALFLIAVCGRPAWPATTPGRLAPFFYAAMVMLFVSATKLTSAANAILLQYTAPVWVALLAPRFLNEPTKRADWFTLAAVLGGMTLFFLDSLGPGALIGNLAALASGVAFASLIISLRMRTGASSSGPAIFGNIVAFVLCLPWCLANPPTRVEDVLGLLFLGVAQLGLSYLLYGWAVRRVSALVAVLVPLIEPLLNPIWVALALGELPGPWSIAGGLIVLAAVTLRSLAGLRRQEIPQPTA